LLDLKLPKKNGFDVLKWLREHPSLKNLVVVVLTTSREHADIKQAYALGANAYLVKPAARQLMEMLKAIKSFWLTFNVFPSPEKSQSH
jgi:CheY-like chemotaxis protein